MRRKGILILGSLGLLILPAVVSAQATCGDTLVCSGTYAMYIKAQTDTLGLWIRAQNKNAIQAYAKSKTAILAVSDSSSAGRFISSGSAYTLSAINSSMTAGDQPTIYGESLDGDGVYGISTGASNADNGVYGETNSTSVSEAGVYGRSTNVAVGVYGYNYFSGADGYGGKFYSLNSNAIVGITGRSDNNYGIYTPDNVYIGGKIDLMGTVDPVIGERFEFDPEEGLEVGDVIVIDDDSQYVTRCSEANDTKVLGIIGPEIDVEDGEVMVITFGNRGAKPKHEENGELPERTVIKVKVDAKYGAVKRGDLLTTSPTPGHAMKAAPVDIDGVNIYRPGTIIGKAMESLESGTGLIEVFVLLN